MTSQRRPRTNAEMSEATIAALVSHARREFGSRGYAGASVERIATEVDLTKGAVYYHFDNKRGLFEAALRDCQREIVSRIEARAGSTRSARDAITDGCQAFVDVVIDDELRQIVLVDGPVVLGYETWRHIDAELGLESLKEGLRGCSVADDGLDVEVVAHFISGALNDLVLFIAESANPSDAHHRVRRQLPSLIASVVDSAVARPA